MRDQPLVIGGGLGITEGTGTGTAVGKSWLGADRAPVITPSTVDWAWCSNGGALTPGRPRRPDASPAESDEIEDVAAAAPLAGAATVAALGPSNGCPLDGCDELAATKPATASGKTRATATG